MTKRKSILSLLPGGILLSIPQAYSQGVSGSGRCVSGKDSSYRHEGD